MTTATITTAELLSTIDDFTRAYLEALFWAETDNSDENTGGDPIEDNYEFDDLDPDSLAQAIDDCRRFQEENAADMALYDHPQWTPAELGGHDFWLTRNGHGAGFWDRNDCLPEDAGQRLTDAAEKYGERCVGVDNGIVYID